MRIQDFQKYLKSLPSKITSVLAETSDRETWYYKRLMSQYSPIDKGQLRDSWVIASDKRTGDTWETTISNTAQGLNGYHYSIPIEEGSAQGSKPWPRPGDRTSLSNNRIFSTQATDGITRRLDDNLIQVSAQHLAEQLINTFK